MVVAAVQKEDRQSNWEVVPDIPNYVDKIRGLLFEAPSETSALLLYCGCAAASHCRCDWELQQQFSSSTTTRMQRRKRLLTERIHAGRLLPTKPIGKRRERNGVCSWSFPTGPCFEEKQLQAMTPFVGERGTTRTRTRGKCLAVVADRLGKTENERGEEPD